jgi:predicted FMN-binding regulatory protein PaiB
MTFLSLFRRKRNMSVEFDALKTKFVQFAGEVTLVLKDKDAKIADLEAKLAAATPVTVQDPAPADVLALSAQVDAAIASLPAVTPAVSTLAVDGLSHPGLV